MATKDTVHGEGNYEASRQYNDATKKFVDSGRVDQAARDAEPKNAEEAASMKRAEEAGLSRAKDAEPGIGKKEEDPGVTEPAPSDPAIQDPQRDPRDPASIEDPSRRRESSPATK